MSQQVAELNDVPSESGRSSIDGNKVMQYVKEVVAIGSRPVGSPGHAKLEQLIHSKLKSDQVEDDTFTAQTPVGSFKMDNIIAKFPGKKDGIIVVAGHYDTNYPLPKSYVGANDGGSSTALLLALADYFRSNPPQGYSVWLVWTDGEEAFVQWSASDSLYGTRHLAQKWQQDGTAKQIKGFLLVDMIGDADLDIQKETKSTPWLSELVYKAASNLGYQSHFYQTGFRNRRRPFADAEGGYSVGRHHRLGLWLQQRVPSHAARHHRQAESEIAGHCGRCGAGNDSVAQRALLEGLSIHIGVREDDRLLRMTERPRPGRWGS